MHTNPNKTYLGWVCSQRARCMALCVMRSTRKESVSRPWVYVITCEE